MHRMWAIAEGLSPVAVENGTIIGTIFRGVLVPIYNHNVGKIKIRLLGIQQIELSPEDVRRLPFGRTFRQTMIVNFVRQPNAHN